jgi:glycolate oxidase
MTTSIAGAGKLRRALGDVVGESNLRDDAGALLTYATDATPLERGRPDLVVFPATTEEVAGVLRLAHEARVPVVPRGSGTNSVAGPCRTEAGSYSR